jgi:hypothetical protein
VCDVCQDTGEIVLVANHAGIGERPYRPEAGPFPGAPWPCPYCR